MEVERLGDRRHGADRRIGRARREARRASASVRGWDIDAEALGVAGERGAIDAAESLGDAVSGAELVIVAAPVRSFAGAGRGGARRDG